MFCLFVLILYVPGHGDVGPGLNQYFAEESVSCTVSPELSLLDVLYIFNKDKPPAPF